MVQAQHRSVRRRVRQPELPGAGPGNADHSHRAHDSRRQFPRNRREDPHQAARAIGSPDTPPPSSASWTASRSRASPGRRTRTRHSSGASPASTSPIARSPSRTIGARSSAIRAQRCLGRATTGSQWRSTSVRPTRRVRNSVGGPGLHLAQDERLEVGLPQHLRLPTVGRVPPLGFRGHQLAARITGRGRCSTSTCVSMRARHRTDRAVVSSGRPSGPASAADAPAGSGGADCLESSADPR